jgi:hypothetical protein
MVQVVLVTQLTNSHLQLQHTLVASAEWADVNYDAELSASVAAGDLKKVTVTGSLLPTFDTKGVRAFVLSGSTFDPNLVYHNIHLLITQVLHLYSLQVQVLLMVLLLYLQRTTS